MKIDWARNKNVGRENTKMLLLHTIDGKIKRRRSKTRLKAQADLKKLKVTKWEEKVQDRMKWKNVDQAMGQLGYQI